MQTWLHLVYKIPRNPSKTRVYVWRKLKRLGAVLLHDSVWCLPSNKKTKEQFQWLAVEIQELGGEASLWESQLLLGMKEEDIIQEFLHQVEQEYAEILEKLKGNQMDIVSLSRKCQQIRVRDYFQSDAGKRVLEQLQNVRGGIEG
ncbi:Chromate resistance protein ChrB [Peribacillus sp. SCS-155]|uniref:Chromate resistance protein ChrB n=1 Tax=Peribacillus sedimenti TaxID=3115297 RepID=UPI003906BC6E